MWRLLPDLIVYSIAIRLTGSLRDIAAFRGACSAWRSVLSRDSAAILDDFLKQHHQPMNHLEIVPSSSSSDDENHEMSWFIKKRPDEDTDVVVEPGLEDGNSILKDRNATDDHGIKITLAQSSFDFVCLTALLTSPDCMIVLVSGSVIQRCSIANATTLCRAVKDFPEGIIPRQPGRDMLSSVIVSVLAYEDRLYVAGCRGRVVEVKMITDDDGDNCVFSRREIWFEESSRAYPVLGSSSEHKLLMFREDEKKVYKFDSSSQKWEEITQAITFTGYRRMPIQNL